jgi:hypothetical protein
MIENPCTLMADINAIYYSISPHLRNSLLRLIDSAAHHSVDPDDVRDYTGLSREVCEEVAETSAKANAWLMSGLEAGRLLIDNQRTTEIQQKNLEPHAKVHRRP